MFISRKIFVCLLCFFIAGCVSNRDLVKEKREKIKEQEKIVSKESNEPIGENFLPLDGVSVVHFGFDKYNINPKEVAKLDEQADILSGDNSKVFIEGHTDYIGTSEYNLALGERRANSSKKYLVKKGIDSTRISTVSYGKDKPINTERTKKARAENRRTVTKREQ